MSLLRAYSEHFLEAGCDEAGRGCLAGPVVAAAVILPRGEDFPDLNDSKQLSEKQRVCLREIIMAKAVSYGVGVVSNEEIDKINILNASFLAMHRAIDQLSVVPELLLIDGNRFNRYKDIDYRCIVKGDATYQSIAAASILAKTTRDFLMCDYAREYPGYFWEKNKGYPTVEHRRAIAKLGVTPLHRKSFNMGIQLSLF